MKLQEFLEENPIINKAELARSMYPSNKSAPTKLSNKLAENKAGSGKQRIIDADEILAKEILEKLAHKIIQYIST